MSRPVTLAGPQGLSIAFSKKADVNNGALNTPTINAPNVAGGSVSSATISGGTISGAKLDGTNTLAGILVSTLLGGVINTVQILTGTSATTDWTSVFQAAINTVQQAGGGIIRIPNGTYAFTGQLTVNTDGTVLKGDGRNTILMLNQNAKDFLIFSNCTKCGVEDLTISGNTSYASVFQSSNVYSPFMVTLGYNTNSAFVRRVDLRFGYNGIHVYQSNGEDQVTDHVTLSSMAGYYGIEFEGSAHNHSYRMMVSNFVAGNVPSYSYGNINAAGPGWKASTAYTPSQTVQSPDGTIWTCISGGTSGGTPPTGIPGSGASTWNATVLDGSVTWAFTSGPMSWIVQNSYAYSMIIRNAALLGGVHGVRVTDTANTSSSHPQWMWASDLEIDHPQYVGIDLQSEDGFYCDSCWIGSQGGYAVEIGPNSTDVHFTNGRAAYNGGGGFYLSKPTNVTISSMSIGLNCGAAVNAGDTQCAGIYIADGTTGVAITGNIIGTLGNPQNKVNPQLYGVYYVGGSSTGYTQVVGNVLLNNATASIFNNNQGPNNNQANNSASN
ncbi:right-handed parallel beta-helix repeat-containing protein [Neokomagataea tanensis]|nr:MULTISPECIES: right-handed parallel beta-helix repeat-containing protein [Neokomagataea]